MVTIKSIFKIGNGPSSSHTVGPYNAARYVKNRYPDAAHIRVTLFGSLALTGEGHGTGKAVKEILPEAEICFDRERTDLPHPNTMLFEIEQEGKETVRIEILSIGGGNLHILGIPPRDEKHIYPENSLTEILDYCRKNDLALKEFIREREGDEVYVYLKKIWRAMQDAVERGLKSDGVLPGGLNLKRKAKILKDKRCYNEGPDVTMNRIVASYAYAVAEENADEQVVVTAPTCGSCGVLPSVMYYMQHDRGFPEEEILEALSVAGLFGSLIRMNASISGAECGCQAEIGSACSMTAAALASLYNLSLSEIEYAAETAMEHNLGLTCDPVLGLVQIPCIERNAVAAMRAIDAVNLSRFLSETRKISFDEVVATMYQTGLDLNEKYRETAHGGLAVIYKAEG